MEFSNRLDGASPFFSVCIPQYNRTSFLLRVLESIAAQTFRDFEICISDDCSTDGRAQEIVDFLRNAGLTFEYSKTAANLRYDKNLRRVIGMARGRYCFLLGNDDMLNGPETLARLHDLMSRNKFPEVVVTNYREIATGVTYRRMQMTGVVGSGPAAAARQFRNFSFVSGLVFDRARTHEFETDQWDVAAFYQMYLGARILAAGGRMLAVSDVIILKDVQIPGERVDSYLTKPVLKNCPIIERPLNLAPIGRLAFAAVGPYVAASEREKIARSVFGQLMLYTYPPWLFEFRRVQSWRYALGVCLGMRTKNVLGNVRVGLVTRMYLTLLHGIVSLAGLCVPQAVFFRFKPWLHRLAKRTRIAR